MKKTEQVLFELLQIAFGHDAMDNVATGVSWKTVYEMAQMQGVAAIAMDGLQIKMNRDSYKPTDLDVNMKLKWYAAYVGTEKNYIRQLSSARELSKIWHAKNIRTLLLKGFAFAAYYPNPSHRLASDMDCYLCGKYEEGNNVMESLGISVNREDYRHSTFRFRDVFVENHKICTTVRGKRQRKFFEAYLRQLLENKVTTTLDDSYMEIPCDRFNALFFLQHSHRHFLREGITLRYICDWAMIISKANCFDRCFWHHCKKNDLTSFAETMTRLAFYVCGVKASWLNGTVKMQKQDLLLLDDCYSIKKNAIKYGDKIKAHVQIVKNMFRMRWKYKYFSSRSFFVEFVTSVWANLFDKEPKIYCK